jgi:hypothetical protein
MIGAVQRTKRLIFDAVGPAGFRRESAERMKAKLRLPV